MATVNMHDAKTQLSRLVDQAVAGEDIIIARAGKPVARLIAFVGKPRIRFGTLAGVLRISDDFDAPLPPDILKTFEG